VLSGGDEKMRIGKILIGVVVILLLLSGCKTGGNVERGEREEIRKELNSLKEGMRSKDYSRVFSHFSRDYLKDFQETIARYEREKLPENVLDIDFTINQVLKKEDMYSVKLKWRKVYQDKKGKVKKAKGEAEVLLKKVNGKYRILDIKGDNFLF